MRNFFIFNILYSLSIPVVWFPYNAFAQIAQPYAQCMNLGHVSENLEVGKNVFLMDSRYGPGFRAVAHGAGFTLTQFAGSNGTVAETGGVMDRLFGITNSSGSLGVYFYGEFNLLGRMGIAVAGPESGRLGGQIGTEFFLTLLTGNSGPAIAEQTHEQPPADCSFRAGGGPDSTLQYGRVGSLVLNSRRRAGVHATLGMVCVGAESVAFFLPHGNAGLNLTGEGPNDNTSLYLGAGGRAGILSRRSNLGFVLDLEFRHSYLEVEGRQASHDELVAGATLIVPLRFLRHWVFFGEGRVRRVVENLPNFYGSVDLVTNEITTGLIYEIGEDPRY